MARLLTASILICAMNIVTIRVSGEGCRLPPEFWCSSAEIARSCQVEKQCSQHVWFPSKTTAKVELGLYYETLCPDCQQFAREQLDATYTALADITDLQLVPYGNAREKQVGDHWEFTCQHGHAECEGNLIQTCALHVVQNMSSVFPFIMCMEKSDQEPHESGPLCAKQHSIDFAAISNCVSSPLGNQLEHQMALLTDKLDPPHEFVPWITLNGVHTDDIQAKAVSDLKKLICDTYTGTKPDACKSLGKKMSCFKN